MLGCSHSVAVLGMFRGAQPHGSGAMRAFMVNGSHRKEKGKTLEMMPFSCRAYLKQKSGGDHIKSWLLHAWCWDRQLQPEKVPIENLLHINFTPRTDTLPGQTPSDSFPLTLTSRLAAARSILLPTEHKTCTHPQLILCRPCKQNVTTTPEPPGLCLGLVRRFPIISEWRAQPIRYQVTLPLR